MKITAHPFELRKRHALTISRGTIPSSQNLCLMVEDEGIVGWGEMAPGSLTASPEALSKAQSTIQDWAAKLQGVSAWDRQRIESLVDFREFPGALAALDMALYDWLGKRLDQPLWKLLGLDLQRVPRTSLTIGMNPPPRVREITREIVSRLNPSILKVKLGSPEGIEADRSMFAAAQEAAPSHLKWRVDANGGWSVASAREMIPWLAGRGVELVEQPLPPGQEASLAQLSPDCPAPLFLDESVATARDIPPVAKFIQGINLKLMKCGGISEALRMIHTARAHQLQVMIGCMSESSLAITAGAQLSPLADQADLDSHLNLQHDPFQGATFVDGRVVPSQRPGLGTLPSGRPTDAADNRKVSE